MAINFNKNNKEKQTKTGKETFAEYLDAYNNLPDVIKTKCLLDALLSLVGIIGAIIAGISMKSLVSVFPFVVMFGLGIFMIFSNVNNNLKGKILMLE